MSTKSRQVIYGSRIEGADIRAKGAREAARKAARETDRAEAEAWSIRMEGYGGPAQPSPTIGLGWLEPVVPEGPLRAARAHDQAQMKEQSGSIIETWNAKNAA